MRKNERFIVPIILVVHVSNTNSLICFRNYFFLKQVMNSLKIWKIKVTSTYIDHCLLFPWICTARILWLFHTGCKLWWLEIEKLCSCTAVSAFWQFDNNAIISSRYVKKFCLKIAIITRYNLKPARLLTPKNPKDLKLVILN